MMSDAFSPDEWTVKDTIIFDGILAGAFGLFAWGISLLVRKTWNALPFGKINRIQSVILTVLAIPIFIWGFIRKINLV